MGLPNVATTNGYLHGELTLNLYSEKCVFRYRDSTQAVEILILDPGTHSLFSKCLINRLT